MRRREPPPTCKWWSVTSRRRTTKLAANGVEVSEVDVQDWGSFVYFADPDGNKWAVQYIPQRPNG